MRIMLVDDQAIVLTSMRYLLESINVDSEGYDDAKRGWEAFCEAPDRFDGLITDLAMPGMRGSELADRIWQAHPGFPVVILSGLIDSDDPELEGANEDGVIHVLSKPAELSEIRDALRTQGLEI